MWGGERKQNGQEGGEGIPRERCQKFRQSCIKGFPIALKHKKKGRERRGKALVKSKQFGKKRGNTLGIRGGPESGRAPATPVAAAKKKGKRAVLLFSPPRNIRIQGPVWAKKGKRREETIPRSIKTEGKRKRGEKKAILANEGKARIKVPSGTKAPNPRKGVLTPLLAEKGGKKRGEERPPLGRGLKLRAIILYQKKKGSLNR